MCLRRTLLTVPRPCRLDSYNLATFLAKAAEIAPAGILASQDPTIQDTQGEHQASTHGFAHSTNHVQRRYLSYDEHQCSVFLRVTAATCVQCRPSLQHLCLPVLTCVYMFLCAVVRGRSRATEAAMWGGVLLGCASQQVVSTWLFTSPCTHTHTNRHTQEGSAFYLSMQ